MDFDLKNCSDQALIDECIRRMYNDDSEILAVKVWTLGDIIYKAGEWCTKEEAKKIAEGLDTDALIACYDAEWKAIDNAIEKYTILQQCIK